MSAYALWDLKDGKFMFLRNFIVEEFVLTIKYLSW